MRKLSTLLVIVWMIGQLTVSGQSNKTYENDKPDRLTYFSRIPESAVIRTANLLESQYLNVEIKEAIYRRMQINSLTQHYDPANLNAYYFNRYHEVSDAFVYRIAGKLNISKKLVLAVMDDLVVELINDYQNSDWYARYLQAGPKTITGRTKPRGTIYQQALQGPGEECTNPDFENCDFTGWEMYEGEVDENPYVMVNSNLTDNWCSEVTGQCYNSPPPSPDCGCDAGNGNYRCHADCSNSSTINGVCNCTGCPCAKAPSHYIVNGGIDEVTRVIPKVFPGGGGCSALIGDKTGIGGRAASIVQTFLVDDNSTNFFYNWAAVLEDPGDHTDGEKPFVKVNMYDENGNEIPCGQYKAFAGDGKKGWQRGTGPAGPYVYHNWTTVFVPLQNYVGQNVTVEFIVGDCSQGGHFGYMYIDMICSPLEILVGTDVPCGDTRLCAPPGAAEYRWSTGENTQCIMPPVTDDYSVTIIPFSGAQCAVTLDTSVVIGPKSVTADFSFTTRCAGEPSNFTDLSTSIGTTINTWEWDLDGDGVIDDTNQNPTYTYTTSGSYNVTLTVTSPEGCTHTITKTVTIIDCCKLEVDTSHVDAGCPGDCSGSVTLVPTTGAPPFTYTWSGNAGNTGTLTGLCAGQYQVTVEESQGCSETYSFIIHGFDEPQLTSTTVDPSCGECTGEISLIPSGNEPFTYRWAHGATVKNLTGLCAGDYEVTLTDVNGCEETHSVSFGNSQPPDVTYNKTDTECGSCDGSASLNITGGMPPFTVRWDRGGITGQDPTGLCAGVYKATVTDNLGCIDSTTITIENSGAPEINVTGYTMNCLEDCAGKATVTITTTSIGPYTYVWDDPDNQTDSVATGLCVGTYNVTVTDNEGCQVFGTATVDQLPGVRISMEKKDIFCFGDMNGWAEVTSTTGGTPPYQYSWSNNATDSLINNLGSGSVSVTVSDQNGCTDTGSVTILEPPQLNIAVNPGITCQGLCNGTVSVTASGGTPPYQYLWSNNQLTSNLNGLCSGVYYVTVTDNHGCIVTGSTLVDSIPPPEASSWTLRECPGATRALPSTEGGTSYTWTPATGLSNPNIAHPTLKFETSGTYRVRITFPNGCEKVDTVKIELIIEPSYKLHIPNAFSPNGDGSNDQFEYTGSFDGIVQFKGSIWNRWGEKIFETDDPTDYWNGRYHSRGDYVKDGVYTYVIKIKDKCGVTANQWDLRVGWIMVMKGDAGNTR